MQDGMRRISLRKPAMAELTHFDDSGASRMVDVSTKPVTWRFARAEAIVLRYYTGTELRRLW